MPSALGKLPPIRLQLQWHWQQLLPYLAYIRYERQYI